jgi:FlgD Ig-like domain
MSPGTRASAGCRAIETFAVADTATRDAWRPQMNIRVLLPSLFLLVFVHAAPVLGQWAPDGVPVTTATGAQEYVTISSDGSNGALITWQDRRSGSNFDVYVQRMSPAGVALWTPDGVPVSTTIDDQCHPLIVGDGLGGAIVVWNDYRTGTNNDIYAQRIFKTGTVAWATDGVAVCSESHDQYRPAIIAERFGGAIIAWVDYRGAESDIYVQRISATGVPQWTADGVPVCSATGYQQDPAIVSDGNVGAIIAWDDYRNDPDGAVYAQKIDGSGASQWTADGVALCTATSDRYSVGVVSDDAGGAIVSWEDYRNGNGDIYARRIDASGNPLGTTNGVAISIAANDQTAPTIGADGSGGAMIAWQDNRVDDSGDIYAQRISASGVAQWTANGIAICTTAGGQFEPGIAADGGGAAIVAWSDGRGNTDPYNIYAQRITAAGDVSWTPDGIALETAAGQQSFSAIAADASGGAIIAWGDYRSGIGDIYAQRIGSSGLVPTGVHDTPRASAMVLSANYPNPFSGETAMTLDLPADAAVNVDVFDVAGHRVRHLDLGHESAGSNAIAFDGRDDGGRPLRSGVYFYRVRAGNETVTRKMVIDR